MLDLRNYIPPAAEDLFLTKPYWRVLIYKNIRTLPCLSDLARELSDNPNLALMLGFHPLRLPYVENFSAFLQDTQNIIF